MRLNTARKSDPNLRTSVKAKETNMYPTTQDSTNPCNLVHLWLKIWWKSSNFHWNQTSEISNIPFLCTSSVYFRIFPFFLAENLSKNAETTTALQSVPLPSTVLGPDPRKRGSAQQLYIVLLKELITHTKQKDPVVTKLNSYNHEYF